MKKEEPQVRLHELHKRRLGASVRLLEQSLARMEDILRESGQRSILRKVQNTLSQEERERILEKLLEFRTSLQDFAQKFVLPGQSLDIGQVLGAELSTAWVMLENCRPKRMKGYGVEWGEHEKEALEEQVGQLLAKVLALQEICR